MNDLWANVLTVFVVVLALLLALGVLSIVCTVIGYGLHVGWMAA